RSPVRVVTLGEEGRIPDAESFDALLIAATPEPLDMNEVTDEWQPICLNYTSGTTGRPKGVVYHHRGAYLNALGNVLELGFKADTVYLWTLPMFHCNGWCHTWAVTAAAGTHVCLDRPDPDLIFRAIEQHGVTHFCCAPVVLYMLLNHPGRPAAVPRRIAVATGGAAPTSALIEQLDALGIDLVHLYGLTESYGPATGCALRDDWNVPSATEKARALARQGVRHPTASRVRVIGDDGRDVARDASTLGEIALRGNTLMAGYLKDPAATEAAFTDGEFHTGDLAVVHPDGYIEIKDRAKDIIISGGENISSLEIETVLHRHPAVLLAAVVAAPDPKWGEVPCAFIELKPGIEEPRPEELTAFCRERLAGFKVPKRFVFRELPKTATGKIQKFALRSELAGTG
ncbi:MAG: AMP-binding protein, partial [Pseudomonadota bacterium]|nr:AMP-binding protein [Pseudomonadota bacterium]